jgi:hypothetical protein
MARINIEDCWWSDPRRSRLTILLGSQALADGLALNAWRLAQEFWKQDRALVPKSLFDMLEGASKFIEANLAEIRGDMVYIRGSSAYLDWINECRESGQRGGKISAQRKRDEKGRLLPNETQPQSKDALDETPSDSKRVQTSLSLSVSNKENTYRANEEGEPPEKLDFEKIYSLYPRRKGNQRKAKGFEVCLKKFNTPDLYESLLGATKNYKAFCDREKKTGTEFVSQFASFVGGIWEEWTAPPNAAFELKPKNPEDFFV